MPEPQESGGLRVIFGRRPGLVFPRSDWVRRKEDALAPESSLKREYVYGYSGETRNSVYFISDTEIVYPVASVVVVLDIVTNSQRYFEGHSNNVLCVAWNEQKRLCISGQGDTKGTVGPIACVWNPSNCQPICELPHPGTGKGSAREVSAVALSPDGQTAVTFARDSQHTFYLWRIRNQRTNAAELQPIYSMASGAEPTSCIIMMSPVDQSVRSSPRFVFAAVGDKQFRIWSVDMGTGQGATPQITPKKAIFGKCPPLKTPTGFTWWSAGTSGLLSSDNGYLYKLMGTSATGAIRLERPQRPGSGVQRSLPQQPGRRAVPLGCVGSLPDGRWIAASADATIYVGSADPELQLEEVKPLQTLGGEEAAAFCSTSTPQFSCVSVRGDLAVFGTSDHALVLIDYVRWELVRVLQVSHANEAWALDFHPTLAIMATGGATKIRFWNVAECRPAVGRVVTMDARVWSLSFLPTDGSLMAVGCDKGVLEVWGFPSLQPVFQSCLSRAKDPERISTLRFNPQGNMLAAGSWDQQIYLLRILSTPQGEGVQVQMHNKVLRGNCSSVLDVMFSADGQIVVSNSKDCQILFWTVKDGALQAKASAFKDIKWQSPWTGLLGWPVIGMWGDPDYDGSDINSACQSCEPQPNVLAFGDDNSMVKLIRFPSPFLNPDVKTYPGHGSHVTAVKFSHSNVLASLGGDDHAICQWSLTTENVSAKPQTRTIVHPWADLEGSEAPRDRFAFIGRPSGNLGPVAALGHDGEAVASAACAAPAGRPTSAPPGPGRRSTASEGRGSQQRDQQEPSGPKRKPAAWLRSSGVSAAMAWDDRFE